VMVFTAGSVAALAGFAAAPTAAATSVLPMAPPFGRSTPSASERLRHTLKGVLGSTPLSWKVLRRSTSIHGHVRPQADRLERLLILHTESDGLGSLDLIEGLEEQCPAVGEPVQTPIPAPQVIRRLPMTLQFEPGYQAFDRPEAILI
jgi:hypothetical protein